MSAPIPPGYHFKIECRAKSGSYSMPNMEIYRDYYSFGYMLAGDRIIITPGKTVLVHPGTIVFLHKNTPHRTTHASLQDYKNFSIKFKDCVAEKLIDSIGQKEFDRLFSQITVHVTPAASEKILSPDPLSDRHQLLFEAIRYMELHFPSDPSLQKTAQAVHVSPAYLSRLFTSRLESSYSDYLTMMKVNHAQKLLVETKLPLPEIAALSGFNNSNYFSDVFRKKLGISPSKFRRENHFPNFPIPPASPGTR